MFILLNEEKEITGMTKSVSILSVANYEVVEVLDCPSDAVGNAKYIEGEVIYNEQN